MTSALGDMSEEWNAIEYCKVNGSRAILVYVSEPIDASLKGSIERTLKDLGSVWPLSVEEVAAQKSKDADFKKKMQSVQDSVRSSSSSMSGRERFVDQRPKGGSVKRERA